MSHTFDQAYWERHWSSEGATSGAADLPVSPYLSVETKDLPVGSALDAGCGSGTEAIWLARQGWRVTGADIGAGALAVAAGRAETAGQAAHLEWVQADLTTWEPGRTWDLVVTHYAHAETGQLALYKRISSWVAVGGALLIVGHLHSNRGRGLHSDYQVHPEHATATAVGIADLFAGPGWQLQSCYESTRTVAPSGVPVELNDIVVRLHRT